MYMCVYICVCVYCVCKCVYNMCVCMQSCTRIEALKRYHHVRLRVYVALFNTS